MRASLGRGRGYTGMDSGMRAPIGRDSGMRASSHDYYETLNPPYITISESVLY